MKIYPLQFEKIFIPKLWGTNDVKMYNYKTESPDEKIGEVWLLSDSLPKSVVKNGELKGKDFTYVMSHYAKNLIGEDKPAFPYLVKYIVADDDLSIQVHPSSRSEIMYVTSKDALIRGGIDEKVTKADITSDPSILDKAIKDHHLKEGDIAYIKPGTLHSISRGTECFEISDNVNVTYRLYDYDRGRDLNLKQGIEALVTESEVKTAKDAFYTGRLSIRRERVEGRKIIEEDENFKIIIPLEGKLSIETNTDLFRMENNEVTLVPYDVTGYSIVGFGQYLDIRPNSFL